MYRAITWLYRQSMEMADRLSRESALIYNAVLERLHPIYCKGERPSVAEAVTASRELVPDTLLHSYSRSYIVKKTYQSYQKTADRKKGGVTLSLWLNQYNIAPWPKSTARKVSEDFLRLSLAPRQGRIFVKLSAGLEEIPPEAIIDMQLIRGQNNYYWRLAHRDNS